MDNFYSEDGHGIQVHPLPIISTGKMKHRNLGVVADQITCKCGFSCDDQKRFNEHIGRNL